MSRVFVSGIGAVSPAGWDVAALRTALAKGEPLPIQPLERPGWEKPLRARQVPSPPARPAFLAHPRLRRTSPLTHYAAAATLEAVAGVKAKRDGTLRLGVIVCLQSGCVQYSYRFFDEVLKDPTTASPLLFPETVFAAPASHVAALLETTPLVQTLIGDPASFLQGLALGAAWLNEKQVDVCLVVGAEETNWLRADALWHLEHAAIICGGAGALCLSNDPTLSLGIELSAITDAHTFTAGKSRAQAARAMREQLRSARGHPDTAPGVRPSPGAAGSGPTGTVTHFEAGWPSDVAEPGNGRAPAERELLCDGLGDSPRADAPERAAWRDWSGPRISPKRLLGEGLMAAAAWQCVAACDAVASGRFTAASVSVVGCNQQAIGARFVRVGAC